MNDGRVFVHVENVENGWRERRVCGSVRDGKECPDRKQEQVEMIGAEKAFHERAGVGKLSVSKPTRGDNGSNTK